MSADTARRLEELIRSEAFSHTDGVPEMIQSLVDEGFTAAALDVRGDWAELNASQDLARFVLGTKAESLERLKPLIRIGHIGDLVSCSHAQWDEDRTAVLQRIGNVFRGPGGENPCQTGHVRLIVRSSAVTEDGWSESSAGVYKSIPNVRGNNTEALTGAIEEVFESYGDHNPENQVLVQEMLGDVTLSGVVMTRTLTSGSPYYVINYDDSTARTDTVTSGAGRCLRTLFLHRGAALPATHPPQLHKLIQVLGELETLAGHDSLDVEFAFTSDARAHVLQVRPIAVTHPTLPVDDAGIAAGVEEAKRFFRDLQAPSPWLVGRSTQLSVMSDWNPAEIIGEKPGRLAFSLYRYLITDEVWALQRAEYGYRDVRPCNLLVDILGHPYIDVRAAFNSFIPASLPDTLAARLVDHYLEYLSKHPQLHDKVEFDVVFTCVTFDFDQRVERLRDAGFTGKEIESLREGLRAITRNGIARCARDAAAVEDAERRFSRIQAAHLPPLDRAFLLLEDARLQGIPAFAHLARGAFVAVSMLRSLAAAGITTAQRTDAFLSSVRTISSTIRADGAAVARGRMQWETFVERYGHLRPGTYDIASAHYAGATEQYLRPFVEAARSGVCEQDPPLDPWDGRTRQAVDRALQTIDLGVDAGQLERFLRRAIEMREFSKFIFTKNLSATLEALAEFGAAHGAGREELAHTRINDLLALRSAGTEEVPKALKRMAAAGREASYVTQAVCLPGLITCETDFVCFEQGTAVPNFVTRKRVRAFVDSLSRKAVPNVSLEGKIALAPSADPGFDWIFSRNIAGLVTMHRGANSHMAIRAAECQLPAAIGVGEALYKQIGDAEVIELDCANRQIRTVR